ncbi:hypothetical protein FS842_011274 [Serendipita sp. 407]|nr:hypothetical protein FS842_011274 [Serendipita sp. 407]
MQRWESNGGSWDDRDERHLRGRRSRREDSTLDSEDESSPVTVQSFSDFSESARSLGLVDSDGSLPDSIQLQKPWLYKRHLTNGNPSPSQARHNQFHQWRLQDKLKTGNGAIVVCLNLDIDPPDVVKTQPCAVLEGWIDPRKLGSAKALEAIGKNLCQQFQSLNARIRYKPFLDPSIDETRRFCINLRKSAKEERLCFYYNGHGVPKPTSSGELWVFNKTYSQYIPVSLYDLQSWLGSPVVYVWDCSAAGNLVQNFIKYAKKRDEEAIARHGGYPDGAPPHSSAIQLAACLASETLPMAPDMPADMFTSCLTSPIEMALRFHYLHQNPPPGVTMDMLHEVPGDLKDRRTPLGELNWIFTAVTDTIAWTSFSRPIFKRLFRQDLLVAALFRNFLLAERVMRNYHCTPHTIPGLPSTATHPLWAAWDRSLEDIIKQLPDLIKSANPPKQQTLEIMEGKPFIPTPFKYEYKSSSFFTDHLTAFEHWMSQGGGALIKVGSWSMPPLEKLDEEGSSPGGDIPRPELVPRKPPAQLPILLQVLLSQAHRMRALTLLCQFVDLGPWAVHLVLEIGIYPYVQKLLVSPQSDLKPLLIFIWSRLIAFDKSCQVDLLRESQFTYFATILDYSSPIGLVNTFEHRAMCAFILASLCRDHLQGQAACLNWNKGTLIDFYHYHLTNSSDFLLKQWCCLAIAQMWDGNNDAKEQATLQSIPARLLGLLQDDVSCEVRAAALYAIAIYCGASGSANPEVNGEGGTGRMSHLTEEEHLELEFGSAVEAIRIIKTDASPIVRKEAVVLISALVNDWRGYFIVAAWVQWEEDKAAKSSDTGNSSIADLALDDWIKGLKSKSTDMKKRHRKFLNYTFFLLTQLYDLAADPHVEVATLASTVVDFITAMLLESPFARIRGTTVRSSTSSTLNSRNRKASASVTASASVSRQGSTTNIAPSTPPSLQRADSAPQVPNRSFPGLMRTSSIASALGSLANLAMGTQSAANTAPPSPSQSYQSDVDLPPGPAINLARYLSPYPRLSSPEPYITTSSSLSSYSAGSPSPLANGQVAAQYESHNLTDEYTPSDIVTALISRDLIRFTSRRRSPETGLSGPGQHLWHEYNVDKTRFSDLEDMGLDAGALVIGSSDGVVRIYNNYDPAYGDGQPVQLVSGFRALSTMTQATRSVGLVSEWNQPLTRLLCGGDSERIYDWDAMSERCITVLQTEENFPVTSIASNPYSRRTFIAGFGSGAIKVFDTRAGSLQTACAQNRREHRAYITNVRYQPGADRQILSASVDGLVHLLDLRYTAGAVQTWEVYPQGLGAFDVHPNSNVFLASSSLGRSWRNQAVSLYTFTPAQQQPRPGQGDGSYLQPPIPILSTNFPSGITAPSRTSSSLPPNVSLGQSVATFHPAEMFYALGTPDGTMRLQGCQFTKSKISAVHSDSISSTTLSNGHSSGTAYFERGNSQIDFPTIR